MKQTRWLSEFSSLSDFTLLIYLSIWTHALFVRYPPSRINWIAYFNGVMPQSTGQAIEDSIKELQQNVVIGDSYAIPIGNNFLYHSDYITTDLVLERQLLNFTYTQALSNRSSAEFITLNDGFCGDVSSNSIGGSRGGYRGYGPP